MERNEKYIEKLMDEVEQLHNETPDGEICDADTILADIIQNQDFEFDFTGIAGDIFTFWHRSSDKKSVEDMFHALTGVQFVDYLEKCKQKLTPSMNWFIDLSDEQKEKTRYINLYKDEFDADVWNSYCGILNCDNSCEQLKIQVCAYQEYDDTY